MANSIPKVKSWDGPRTAATWWSPFGKKKKIYKTPNKAVQPGPKLIITTFKIQATCGANYGGF